jgi:hypothetical protein
MRRLGVRFWMFDMIIASVDPETETLSEGILNKFCLNKIVKGLRAENLGQRERTLDGFSGLYVSSNAKRIRISMAGTKANGCCSPV